MFENKHNVDVVDDDYASSIVWYTISPITVDISVYTILKELYIWAQLSSLRSLNVNVLSFKNYKMKSVWSLNIRLILSLVQ